MSQVQWMDSCAAANQPMLNHLWLDRRAIETVLLSTGRAGSNLVVSMLPLLRRLKRWVSGTRVPAPSRRAGDVSPPV
jgi:hypothetical protein